MLWVFWAAFAVLYVTICALEFFTDLKQPELSILLLVRDCQEVVEGVIRDIERLVRWQEGRLELVVVDCGSLDDTPLILGKMKEEGLKYKLVSGPAAQGLNYCSGLKVLEFSLPDAEVETRKLFFVVWKASSKVPAKKAV